MTANRAQDVADVIAALEDPTPDAVYHATQYWDADLIAAAGASVAASGGGGGGGSQPSQLYARLSIRGGVGSDSGADVAVPLVGTFFSTDTTRNIDAMAFTGPSTFTAGHQGITFMYAPAAIPDGGILVLNYAEFMLSNGAGTEKLRIEYDGAPITISLPLTRYYLPFADCSVGVSIGSDLTLVSFDPGGGNVPAAAAAAIESAAGGQFFQELLVTLGYTPPA